MFIFIVAKYISVHCLSQEKLMVVKIYSNAFLNLEFQFYKMKNILECCLCDGDLILH